MTDSKNTTSAGKAAKASSRRRGWMARCIGYPLVLLAIAPFNFGDGLFYHPDSDIHRHDLPAHCEEVSFLSRDGTRLHGWFMKPPSDAHSLDGPNDTPPQAEERQAEETRAQTVLVFHGNAQNLTAHSYFVDWLPERGFNVFIFDYRGYGKSEGRPSRAGTVEDGYAALQYLRSRADVDKESILILGQSLGGAIALAVLGEYGAEGVRGVAVEGSFADYLSAGNGAIGGTALTWPLAWLLVGGAHDPADSLNALAGLPFLVIHGKHDRVVGYEQGRKLFKAMSEPKEFYDIKDGGHLDYTARTHYRDRLTLFFRDRAERR